MQIQSSLARFFRYEKGNYRRGGLFMLPFVSLGIILAYLFGDTGLAMGSIALAGYGMALILILMGNRSVSKE